MTHKMTMLVLQLAVIILSARFFGFIFKKYLKQSSVLGELAAGMIIGPFALGGLPLPFLHGEQLFPVAEFVGHNAGTSLPVSPELYGFATVASIVLLFLSGLETDLRTFLKFSLVGSIVGIGGVVVSFFLGDIITVLFFPGVTSMMDPRALFLGVLSTATSVGITARILSEKRKMSSPEGVTILAAAVLDDVIGIILLAIVIGIGKVAKQGGTVSWGAIGLIGLKAVLFWLISTILGIFVAPYITRKLKWFESMEVIAMFCFGLGLLLAGLSELAHLAMIIGAYVMGLALSQTDMAEDIRKKLEGLYSFIVPIFFCVMGMMVDFSALPGVAVFGGLYSLLAIVGKMIGCGLPALFAGFNLKGAFRIGAGMLPRGEVTLIIAGNGLIHGLIGKDMFGVAIMTLLIASVVAPPVLVTSFKGGSGYKKKMKSGKEEDLFSLEFPFPSVQLAEFIKTELLSAFKNEQFFVQRVHNENDIYSIRKDKNQVTLTRDGKEIRLTTQPENENLVRLISSEVLLNLKDMLKGTDDLLKSDTETELLGKLFE